MLRGSSGFDILVDSCESSLGLFEITYKILWDYFDSRSFQQQYNES